MGIFERILERADTVGQNCDFVMEYFGVGKHKPIGIVIRIPVTVEFEDVRLRSTVLPVALACGEGAC